MSERINVTETRLHRFGGKPPDGSATWQEFAEKIPVYEVVDRELLYQGDDAPFHIVLDVMTVEAVSGNGLIYDEELVSAIETQLPGSGGIRGHVAEADEATAFPIDAVDWIGHLRVDGLVYAKAYVPPGETREDIRRRMARGGKLRTSIDGSAVREMVDEFKWRAREFELNRLDLAPPHKAALRHTQSGRMIPARETEQADKEAHVPENDFKTAADVPKHLREQIIKEAQIEADASRVQELERKLKEQDEQLRELRRFAEIVGEIRATIGEDADPVSFVSDMHSKLTSIAETLGVNFAHVEVRVIEMHEGLQEYRREIFERAVEAEISELTKDWNVTDANAQKRFQSLQRTIKRAAIAQLGDEREENAIKETVQKLWDEDFLVLAEGLRDALAGPGALVGGRQTSQETEDWKDQAVSEEGREAVQKGWGV